MDTTGLSWTRDSWAFTLTVWISMWQFVVIKVIDYAVHVPKIHPNIVFQINKTYLMLLSPGRCRYDRPSSIGHPRHPIGCFRSRRLQWRRLDLWRNTRRLHHGYWDPAGLRQVQTLMQKCRHFDNFVCGRQRKFRQNSVSVMNRGFRGICADCSRSISKHAWLVKKPAEH